MIELEKSSSPPISFDQIPKQFSDIYFLVTLFWESLRLA
jgi:hypothetical protein